ncbi:class I SAM-dependent methyltransferase [Erythrobacter sp. R86502]|uniref:class I SAM-dependent methyltransferase n=1 Tax=Erythrobacter sp. R86502 TaxID=3093846 RepID=UPI0036D4296E
MNVEAGIAARDNFRCSNCRSMMRQRDLAQIIVDEFGDSTFLDLRRLVESGGMNHLAIYEAGITGPIAARLKNLPGYVQSYFWEDARLGEIRDGVYCQDLRALTFSDQSFDLMISMEVLEHVFDPLKVFSEIERVLKPNGVHIFTMPVVYPFPKVSSVRARLAYDGKVEHLLPPRYHIAGDGSKSLVVTDWGGDLFDLHRQAGLKLTSIRRSAPVVEGIPNATFIARKMVPSNEAHARRQHSTFAARDQVTPHEQRTERR